MRIVAGSVAILAGLGLSVGMSVPFSIAQQSNLPQTQVPGQLPRVEELLRQIEANYLRAEMEDDSSVADTILAEDFVGIRGDGSTSNREDILNSLAKRPRNHDPYRIVATNMREHIFGDTACVTYTKVYTLSGNRGSYSENVLHIFTQRNGAWRLQISSPIPGGKQ